MRGYYITVKKGLLDKKHVKNMQINQKTSAIWLYLWFLDKVTRVENDLGVVLGGKPFRIKDFDLAGEQATQKMFQCLQKYRYIKVKRTPHGNIIWITKAFKVFGLKATENATSSEESAPSLSKKVLHHPKESATSNKTIQYDNNTFNTTDVVLKEKTPVFGNEDINEAIEIMKRDTGHITKTELNRFAVNRLFKKFGKEKTLRVWEFSQKYKDKPYCPMILNFMDLEEKWKALEAFATRAVQKPISKSAVYREEAV